jgi:hypothetical protein
MGRGIFRHSGVRLLGRILDTSGVTFLAMAKNASGRIVPYDPDRLYHRENEKANGRGEA